MASISERAQRMEKDLREATTRLDRTTAELQVMVALLIKRTLGLWGLGKKVTSPSLWTGFIAGSVARSVAHAREAAWWLSFSCCTLLCDGLRFYDCIGRTFESWSHAYNCEDNTLKNHIYRCFWNFAKVTNAQLEALRIENRHLRDTALNDQLTVGVYCWLEWGFLLARTSEELPQAFPLRMLLKINWSFWWLEGTLLILHGRAQVLCFCQIFFLLEQFSND